MKYARRFVPLTMIALALISRPLQAAPAPQQGVPDQLDLKTAIGFAVENNFAIRQARERIRQQEGVLVEVRAREIPNVSSTAAYQLNEKTIPQTVPASNQGWSLSITASQVLFAG